MFFFYQTWSLRIELFLLSVFDHKRLVTHCTFFNLLIIISSIARLFFVNFVHRGKETLKWLSTLQLIVLYAVYSWCELVRCSASASDIASVDATVAATHSFAYRILLRQININVCLLVLMRKTVMMMRSTDETWDDASCWWWWWAEHTYQKNALGLHLLSNLYFFYSFLLTWMPFWKQARTAMTSTGHLSHSTATINSVPLFLSN